MKKMSDVRIIEYKYDSEKERELHINSMKSQGFECGYQSKRSDDSLLKNEREYYWYGKFFNYEN